MKAFRLHGPGLEHARLDTIEPPRCLPGHALIRVRAATLNYRDLAIAQGKMPLQVAWPVIPCSDFAGEIIAIDAPQSGLRVGQRVSAHYVQGWIDGPPRVADTATNLGIPGPGVLAQTICLPARGLLPLPDDLDDASAACLPVAGVTAWNAIMRSEIDPCDRTIVIQGTGGVALFGLQIAHAAGAHTIVLTSSEQRAALARSLGADHTIDYRALPDWHERVIELTAGAGADLILDVAGGANLARSLKAAATGGVIACCGFLDGMRAQFDVPDLLMRSLRVRGIRVGSREHHLQLLAFCQRRRIKPVIGQRHRLADARAGFEALAAAAHVGKIVIDFDDAAT
ncbi:MAG: NAD(P)-dependent alcohol dehydrogenase [Burkholderiaceae bacterium]